MNAISDLLGALGTISTSPTLLLVILLGVILGTGQQSGHGAEDDSEEDDQ